MDAKSLVYSLIVMHASRPAPTHGDDEQYRAGYWDAIVHAAQYAHGLDHDAAATWVHAQYTALCDAERP